MRGPCSRSAPQGRLPELTSSSTGDYLESWLCQVRGRVRARTYSGYAGLLRRYAIPALGAVPLGDLHPLHLQHLYGALLEEGAGGYRDRLSASTVLNLHRVLVQSLGWAERSACSDAVPPGPINVATPRQVMRGPIAYRAGYVINYRAYGWRRQTF